MDERSRSLSIIFERKAKKKERLTSIDKDPEMPHEWKGSGGKNKKRFK